jgi:hypothetical protein
MGVDATLKSCGASASVIMDRAEHITAVELNDDIYAKLRPPAPTPLDELCQCSDAPMKLMPATSTRYDAAMSSV